MSAQRSHKSCCWFIALVAWVSLFVIGHTTSLGAEAGIDAPASPAEQSIADWKARFGSEGYRLDRDPDLGLIYLTALDDRSHRVMREMLERQASFLIERMYGEPPEYDVAVIIPTPNHSRQFFNADNIGGMYSHRERRLVARDIGFSLRHEFVHLLHFGHMERLQQPHQMWVQEGIAALFEDYDLRGQSIRFIANERHNVIRNRVRAGHAMPWNALFDLSGERFMTRATALYPQARSIFEFVADQGKLEAWYQAYVEHFEQDETGRVAFETVFDAPIREIERQWRRWVLAQPTVANRTGPGDPSIGIETNAMASNDGVLVTGVLRNAPAREAGLRRGDVIVAIENRITPTVEELRQAILERGTGQTARVTIRRGTDYMTVNVRIEALDDRRRGP